jgi:hypothetical protein
MRYSIVFRSLAVLLFLAFLSGFVSYHVGIIRADDLTFFFSDSAKPRPHSLQDSNAKIYDSIMPVSYEALTSKSGVVFRKPSDSSKRIQHKDMGAQPRDSN